MEVFGLLAVVIIIVFFISSNSFESKTIRIAMEPLQKTNNSFPEDSTEYLPSPGVMKATLKENWFPEQSKKSLQRDYGEVNAEYAAFHLLDYVGQLFIQNSKPDMGGWFFAARDSLPVNMEKEFYKAIKDKAN